MLSLLSSAAPLSRKNAGLVAFAARVEAGVASAEVGAANRGGRGAGGGLSHAPLLWLSSSARLFESSERRSARARAACKLFATTVASCGVGEAAVAAPSSSLLPSGLLLVLESLSPPS